MSKGENIPELNAFVSVRRLGDKVILHINPDTEELGIQLSRFYLLTEHPGEMDAASFGPVRDAAEEDTPITLLMIDVSGYCKPDFRAELDRLFARNNDSQNPVGQRSSSPSLRRESEDT